MRTLITTRWPSMPPDGWRSARSSSSLYILCLTLLMFHSLIIMVAAAPAHDPTVCDFNECIGGNPIDRIGCSDLKSVHRCLRAFKTVCHSDLLFRSLHSMVRKRLHNSCQESTPKQRRNRHQQGHPREPDDFYNVDESHNNHPRVRSGDHGVPAGQNVNKQPKIYHSSGGVAFSPPMSNGGKRTQPEEHEGTVPNSWDTKSKVKPFEIREQYCLGAAYNFTIGQPIRSLAAIYSDYDNNAIRPIHDDDRLTTINSQIVNRPNYRKHRARRQAWEQTESILHTFQDRLPGKVASLLPPASFAALSSASSSASASSSNNFKPVQPMTPSMSCMIFGDPHLRTFDSNYQTCNCLGTRSLIEHPLFDVQITNSKITKQFNGTGVTKVTVLIRHFSPCQIGHDLIYEADSLSQEAPSAMFTDNSESNHNNMIRIDRSAQDKVVTINLEHIGVRIYISQFPSTPFLNVVIKFRTATTRTVNHSLVLEAISPYSLCKSGCHPRELVNIKEMLEQAGIDTKEKEYQFDKAPKERPAEMGHANEGHDRIGDGVHGQPAADDNEEGYDDDVDGGGGDDDDGDDYLEDDEEEDVPMSYKRIRRDTNEKRRRKARKESNKQSRPMKSTMLRSNEPVVVDSAALTSIEKANYMNDRQLPIAFSNHLCDDLKGYYRLTCLYDVHLKKMTSDQPHSFASSFDEVRAELAGVRVGIDSSSQPASSSSPSSLTTGVYLLASSLLLCACWFKCLLSTSL